MSKYLILIILLCAGSQALSQKQKQGIQGKVFWIEGDQMPGPDAVLTPQEGVQREIFIYEATKITDVSEQGGFFSNIRTKLVLKAKSEEDGSFKVRLAPGLYSVFVMESNGLYANLFDASNFINPVLVKPRTFAWLTIAIDYKAAY
jgi:hypothetical protein